MNTSASPDIEMDDSCFDDFDPRLNFSKSLEESEEDFKASTQEEAGRKWLAQEKEGKKSWKHTLFSWLNSDKKSKSLPKPQRNSHTSNKRRVHVSGPIYTGATAVDGRPRHRPISGPSMPTEMEIPCMCLHQLTSPIPNHNYGPIYLVT